MANMGVGTALGVVAAMVLAGCSAPTPTTAGKAQAAVTLQLPEPDSEGAGLLQSYCTQCHAAPQPTVHLAAHWPNVVYRMQIRRQSRGYQLMTEAEMQIIVEYLQRHARPAA